MSTTAPALVPFALAPYPSIGESLRFQLTGLVVVFIVLGAIWALMEIIGAFFKRRQAALDAAKKVSQAPVAIPPVPAPVVSAPPAPLESGSGPSAEITAVIAAAVHMTLGPRFRIHSIAPVSENLDWAREGRRTIFASHKTR